MEDIFSFVLADTHLSGGLTSALGFHGLSRTLARIVHGREGPPKDMNFHSHRIILSIKQLADGRKGKKGNSVFNEIYGRRGPFVRANWRPRFSDKDPMPRIEKSIEKKRIARGILRR